MTEGIKKYEKNILKILSVFACSVAISTSVLVATKSYEFYYDMTGGVFSKELNPKSYVKVSVAPMEGLEDASIQVFWAKKDTFGWEADLKGEVNSMYGGSVKFKATAKKHVWLRQYTGF